MANDQHPHYEDHVFVQCYGYFAVPLKDLATILPKLRFGDRKYDSNTSTYSYYFNDETKNVDIHYVSGERLTVGMVEKALRDANERQAKAQKEESK